jgi:hypothetical protein
MFLGASIIDPLLKWPNATENKRYIRRKGNFMKIKIEKSVVEFVPQNDSETIQLETLWNTIVDCVKFNKKLVPIGEYIPQKSNMARFNIEE